MELSGAAFETATGDVSALATAQCATAPKTPELRLLVAILQAAIEDYRKWPRDPEPIEWFLSESKGLHSFVWICDVLKFDPDAVRKKLGLEKPKKPLRGQWRHDEHTAPGATGIVVSALDQWPFGEKGRFGGSSVERDGLALDTGTHVRVGGRDGPVAPGSCGTSRNGQNEDGRSTGTAQYFALGEAFREIARRAASGHGIGIDMLLSRTRPSRTVDLGRRWARARNYAIFLCWQNGIPTDIIMRGFDCSREEIFAVDGWIAEDPRRQKMVRSIAQGLVNFPHGAPINPRLLERCSEIPAIT